MTQIGSPSRGSASGRKPQQATLEKLDRIEAVGAELFARLGYHGVSMRDIAEASAAQLGTLSYFYADKQDLYDRILRKALAQFELTLVHAAGSGDTAHDRLLNFIGRLVRVHFERTTYGQIIARETVDGPDSRLAILGRDTFRNLRKAINPLILELGGARSEEDASRITGRLINMIYAAVRGESLYASTLGLRPISVERQIDQLQDMVLRGLVRGSRTATENDGDTRRIGRKQNER